MLHDFKTYWSGGMRCEACKLWITGEGQIERANAERPCLPGDDVNMTATHIFRPELMPMPSCDGCRYGEATNDPEHGNLVICKRYPPSILADGSGTVFPTMSPLQWCGEFRPRFDPSQELAG